MFNEDQDQRTSAQILRDFEGAEDEQRPPALEEDPPTGRKGGAFRRTMGALMRGPARTVNEISNTVVGLSKTAVKVSGAYKLGDDESEGEFLDWYHQKTREVNPLQIPVGERDTGVYGFVESVSQFAAGMVGFSKFLKPLQVGARGVTAIRGAAAATPKLVGAVDAAVAGGLTDLTAFDPYEGRLSNMIAASPVPVASQMAKLLASEEDDPEVVARLKATTEGLLTGLAVEYMLHGVRAYRVKRALDKGLITPEEASNRMAGIATAIEKTTPESVGDAAKVTTLHDGSVVVRPTAKPEPPDFSSLTGKVEESALEMTQLSHEKGRPAAAFLDPKDGTVIPTGLSHDPDAILDPGQRQRILDQAPEGGYMEPDGSWLTREDAAEKYKAQSGESSQVREAIDRQFRADGSPRRHPEPLPLYDDDLPVKPLPLLDDLPVKDLGEGEATAAALNMAKSAAERPARVLTETQKSSIMKVVERINSGVDPEDAFNLAEGLEFNFNYVGSTDDAKAVINAMAEVLPRPAEPRTWAESVKMAQKVVHGVSGEQMIARARELWGNVADLDVHLLATRAFLHDHGRQIAKLSGLVDTQPNNPVLANEMGKMLDNMLNIADWLSGAESSVGRGLNILKSPIDEVMAKIPPKAAREAPEAGAKGAPAAAEGIGNVKKHPLQVLRENRAKGGPNILKGLSPREMRALARSLVFSDGDPDKILKAMTVTNMTKREGMKDSRWWWRLINGIRVEMMLSGPKTQEINIAGNAAAAVQIPTEHFLAGLPVPFRRPARPELMRQGWDEWMGNFYSLKDAAEVAKRTYKSGVNTLDPEFGTVEFGAKISNDHVGWRWLGFFRPTRYLMTADEFFKQLAYRRQVRGMSLRRSAELKMGPQEAAKRLMEDMELSTTPEGAALNPFALQGSRESTFTQPLEYGIGKMIGDNAEQEPATRIVFPFVRTPVNLFRHSLDRTPVLNRLSRRFRQEMAAGGERKAIAQAKEEMGMVSYAMGAYLVYNGHITGGGPKDYNLNKQWQQAGNRPYTVNIGGKRIDYRRWEPISTPIALIADFIETLGHQPDDAETGEMVQGLTAAMVANMTNKTFLTGVSSFFDAVSSGDPNKFGKFGSDFANSFYPNFAAQVNSDEVTREVRTMLERLQSRVPGWSTELEPQRNLFGEQVMKAPGYFNRAFNPFTSWDIPEDDDVAQVMMRFGRTYPMPTETKADGRIELFDRKKYDNGTGQSPYDRWMEILSTPIKGGKTLRQALEAHIKTDAYREAGAGTKLLPGGERYDRLNVIVQTYISIAEGLMIEEYPLVKQALIDDEKLVGATMMSSDTTLLNRK